MGVCRLETFLSPDDSQSWYQLDQPTIDNAGNPASLLNLADGRLALVYGWRHPPYGLRVRLSSDQGQSWSREVVLRADGDSWDIGYPRSIQRADGNIVSVIYFKDATNKERYITATIWDPGAVQDDCYTYRNSQRTDLYPEVGYASDAVGPRINSPKAISPRESKPKNWTPPN